ncbi:MAG: TIGR04282 family arsenosugar biosynthesis glycosyltransferase [Planctomycetes bacterium]|nr:TIGR04282 family arsenosugar biosynthesis glycosyltransferase [Planctomycetota bacterium]
MDQLGIFAKYWEPGKVKTRLGAQIGQGRASRLYRAFLDTTLARLAQVAQRRVLAFTPSERQEDFAQLADNAWVVEPQSNGDLGHRMWRYFEAAFAAGARRVVLLGSDSPTVTLELIQQAFDHLEESEVVLGPTHDGGYYLVGAAGGAPPIFDNISWSSSTVWQQTVERLHDAGCSYAELPKWYDVDDRNDLLRLEQDLRSRAECDLHLRRLQTIVQEVIQSLTKEERSS